MATLEGKIVVVVGGSSGIGFGVALASLQSFASTVIIALSNRSRVENAVERLQSHKLPGKVQGEVFDAKDSAAVKKFATDIGIVDHIVWSSDDLPGSGGASRKSSLSRKAKMLLAAFTVRFWGPFVLAQNAKFHPGVYGIKPPAGMNLPSSVCNALDGLVRGLAVDLAPVRVNVVSPGVIETELFDKAFGDKKEEALKAFNEKILLKRAGNPTELAEAYLFLMKCGYITGQRIDVEGGMVLI